MTTRLYIKVKVQAGAKTPRVVEKSKESFVIAVKEPAENGRANRAVLAVLAERLRVPVQRLWIIKGAHAPAKIIAVRPS